MLYVRTCFSSQRPSSLAGALHRALTNCSACITFVKFGRRCRRICNYIYFVSRYKTSESYISAPSQFPQFCTELATPNAIQEEERLRGMDLQRTCANYLLTAMERCKTEASGVRFCPKCSYAFEYVFVVILRYTAFEAAPIVP